MSGDGVSDPFGVGPSVEPPSLSPVLRRSARLAGRLPVAKVPRLIPSRPVAEFGSEYPDRWSSSEAHELLVCKQEDLKSAAEQRAWRGWRRHVHLLDRQFLGDIARLRGLPPRPSSPFVLEMRYWPDPRVKDEPSP